MRDSAGTVESDRTSDEPRQGSREQARLRKQKHDERLRNRGQQLCPDEPERFACVIHLSAAAKDALVSNRRNNRTLAVGPILDSKYVEQLLVEDVARGQGFWRAAQGLSQSKDVEAANLAHLAQRIQSLERANRTAAELRKERDGLKAQVDAYEEQLAGKVQVEVTDLIAQGHALSSVAFEMLACRLIDVMAEDAPPSARKRALFGAVTEYVMDLVEPHRPA